MQRSRIIPMLLCCCATIVLAGSLHAAPGDDSTYDAAQVRQAVRVWGARHPGFDTSRPTILFATSLRQCSGCCATAANVIAGMIDRHHLDVNYLVVIGTDIPREGLALRKLFKGAVSEDAAGVLPKTFRAGSYHPDLYMIGPDGTILFRRADVQHNPVDLPMLATHIQRWLPARPVTLQKGVPLAEEDDHLLTAAESVSLDLRTRSLRLLEPRRTTIYEYDLGDGRLLRSYTPDDSLAYYFRKPGDDWERWRGLAGRHPTMVAIRSVLPPDGSDTVRFVAEMFKEYKVMGVRSNGDTVWRWYKGLCEVGIEEGRLVYVTPLPEGKYHPFGEMGETGSMLISPCIRAGSAGNGPLPPRDSLYCLVAINRALHHAAPAVPVRDVADPGRYDPKYPGHLSANPPNTFYYLHERSGVFLYCWMKNDSIAFRRIAPRGLLLERVQVSSTGLQVLDMHAGDSGAYVLMRDDRAGENQARLHIQYYDSNGDFRGERVLEPGSGGIIGAQIAGTDRGHLVLLVKRREERWSLDRLPLSELP